MWLLVALFVVAVVARAAWLLSLDSDRRQPLTEGEYAVERVIDGDTLVLEAGRRVRLQGIDAPELSNSESPAEPLANEAKRFTQQFVQDARGAVRVTFTDERVDRYGRTLAFVWADDRCLNEELVREGLAHARLDYRFSGTMRTRLRDALHQAQQSRVGVWAAE